MSESFYVWHNAGIKNIYFMFIIKNINCDIARNFLTRSYKDFACKYIDSGIR